MVPVCSSFVGLSFFVSQVRKEPYAPTVGYWLALIVLLLLLHLSLWADLSAVKILDARGYGIRPFPLSDRGCRRGRSQFAALIVTVVLFGLAYGLPIVLVRLGRIGWFVMGVLALESPVVGRLLLRAVDRLVGDPLSSPVE